MSNHFFAPSKVAKWNQHLEKKIIENIRSHSVSKGFKNHKGRLIYLLVFVLFDLGLRNASRNA